MLRCACGSRVLPATTCPHCGSRPTLPGSPAALVLLGLAGCVGATTDEKATDHSGSTSESTTPVEPPYGVPTDTQPTEPHSGGSGAGSGTSSN